MSMMMKIHVTMYLFALFVFVGAFFTKITLGEESNTKKITKNEQQSVVDTDKDVVAIVNGQKITRQDLSNLLIDTYGEDALEVLIRRALIYQEAEKEGINVTATEVEQKLKKLVSTEIEDLMRINRIKDKADLEKELAKVGASFEQFEEKLLKKMRKQAEVEILAEKIMTKTIAITEEDLQKAYDLEYGEKIEASQIVFKSRRDAEEALKKLRAGADFETLAKNESIDRASAVKGGKMQPFSPKDTVGKEVASLKIGELSDIIKTDYGYHIMKVTNRKTASNKSYKAVRGELEKVVKNQRYRERIGPWLISLVENASITKNLNRN